MADDKQDFDLVVLGDQISQTVEKYWKPFLGVVMAGVAVSAVFVLKEKSAADKEAEAFETLFAISDVYQKKKADFQAGAAQKSKKDTPPQPEGETSDGAADTKEKDPPKPVASGDLDKDYGQIVQKLESFIQGHPTQQASGEAALTLAGLYEDHDKPQKAVETLTNVLAKWSGGSLMGSLMQMKAGDIWSQLGDCTKALNHWTPLSSQKGFMKDEATLKVGLCHQKLGDNPQAKVWFQKLVSTSPGTPAGTSAKKFLRFLQFQEKLNPSAKDQSQDKSDTNKDKNS